ncbi:MAG: hypothetical protein MUE53_09010 [Chitinophagales bacterium]|jgi:hypothetical protein|nr:hypothetical protein [Chitinophagales bacterium]
MSTKTFFISLAILSITFIGCKKIEEIAEDRKVMEENSICEQINADLITLMDDAYYKNGNSLVTRSASSSAVLLADSVIITLNASDSSILVDFGTGYLCRDGRTRKGKTKFTFSNGFRVANAKVTQTFDNFSVNGYSISNSSTRSQTYKGLNASNQPHWDFIANLTLTTPTLQTIQWSSNRVRTMISGFATAFNFSDDVYEISGSGSGTTSTGSTFTLSITKNLTVKIGCKHIQSGIIDMVRGNGSKISIDYGNFVSTTCDNQAVLTYNGKDYNITLQ